MLGYGLAALSGVLLALSFPRFGHPAFAWISLVPLLIALNGSRTWGQSSRQRGPGRAGSAYEPFLLGLTAGVIYFIGTIYWTGTVVRTFGGLATPVAVLAMVLLALYLALYPALAAVVTARVIRQVGPAGMLVMPAAWVATEYTRGFLFGGFPWVPLGNSQVTVLPVAQLASIFGVYGLSALVTAINACIAFALLSHSRQRLGAVAAATVLLAVVGGWGAQRVADGSLTRGGTLLRVGLIQANIAQQDKWNPAHARRIFTTYVAMTRDAVRRGADFVIWPESSTPFMFEEDELGEASVRELAREVQVPILFGSDQVERDGESVRLFNAAFVVTPEGETAAVYRKMHLVPFGEYIPFKQLLYFVSPLVERFAEFAPGTSMVVLPVGEHRINTAICYEVVFPSLMRQAVLNGSQLLTTITNDAWYGESSAPYQHFALASMRAIEQGRYLARSANTGISGVVDPYGRVVRASTIFEEVGMVEEVRLITSRTIYTAIGDVIAYAAIALTIAALFLFRGRGTAGFHPLHGD